MIGSALAMLCQAEIRAKALHGAEITILASPRLAKSFHLRRICVKLCEAQSTAGRMAQVAQVAQVAQEPESSLQI